MKAMILAAGQGTRLRPITDDIPKPMVEIGGKPVLEDTIELLRKYNVSEIIVNLHYSPDTITDYFGNGRKWGVAISYSREERLLGTAGAVKNVESYFDDTFLVFYGDNISNCNIARMFSFHQAKKGIAAVAVFEKADVTSSGIVELDSCHQITRFLEKPSREQVFSSMANAGIYILEPEVFKYIPENEPYDFGRDLFPRLLREGEELYGYVMSDTEYLLWIDTLDDYWRVQDLMSQRGTS